MSHEFVLELQRIFGISNTLYEKSCPSVCPLVYSRNLQYGFWWVMEGPH